MSPKALGDHHLVAECMQVLEDDRVGKSPGGNKEAGGIAEIFWVFKTIPQALAVAPGGEEQGRRVRSVAPRLPLTSVTRMQAGGTPARGIHKSETAKLQGGHGAGQTGRCYKPWLTVWESRARSLWNVKRLRAEARGNVYADVRKAFTLTRTQVSGIEE
ncbi:hypothetical protein AAFF_G00092740 [Aldrovandia affinis]|uniref:Uncharacterized protein n=1 Tax=Aldrovandia affinis TaxID=143900 RepID=A0AAD7WY62_9TELE|nr:hypothetical protein AAFF_G00092740 [Aldrovandia affinis]